MISSYCINNSKVYFVVLCKFSGSVPEAIAPHLLSCYQNHATYSWSPSNFKLVWCILNEIRDLAEIGNFPVLVQGKSRIWTIFRYFLLTHEIDSSFYEDHENYVLFSVIWIVIESFLINQFQFRFRNRKRTFFIWRSLTER